MSQPDDTNHPDNAKAIKKALKAQTKLAKKEAKANQPTDPPTPSRLNGGLTPAERSAAAAERQVRLQRWRVILAIAGVAVGIATILLSTRPWEKETAAPPGDQTSQSSTESSPTP